MKAWTASSTGAGSSSRPTPTWWIRQAITRAIADHSRTIRLPVHMVETLHRISRVNRAMVNEMAASRRRGARQEDGVPAAKVRLILESSHSRSRSDADREIRSSATFLEDKSTESPNDTLISQDLTNQVERASACSRQGEGDPVPALRHRGGGEHTLEESASASPSPQRNPSDRDEALSKLRHPCVAGRSSLRRELILLPAAADAFAGGGSPDISLARLRDGRWPRRPPVPAPHQPHGGRHQPRAHDGRVKKTVKRATRTVV